MAKLIKRKPVSIQDKFKAGQVKVQEQLRLNKETEEEQFLNKVLASSIAPIINAYYVDYPPVVSSRTPYYAKAGFKKSVTMIRRAIKGTLYNDTEFRAFHDRKFSIDEILESIGKHKLALSPEYKPCDKKFLKVTLDQFFHNPYAKSIGRSFMLYWMGVDPMPVMKAVEDLYPELTAALIKAFEWYELDSEDRNNIVKGVAEFKSILSVTKLNPIFRLTPKGEAEILWTILIDIFDSVGKPVMPRNMVSPKFSRWVTEGLANSDYTF